MPRPATAGRRTAQQEKIDALSARLTDAVEQLVTGEDWLRAIRFAARFRSRSFTNTLLIMAQHMERFSEGTVPGPAPTLVAGFRQWQQLGRSVVKGQSGYVIRAPVHARFASSDPQNSTSWRRLGPHEKPRPGESVTRRLVGVKPTYVWDVSQTTGEPLPRPPRPVELDGSAPAGLWEGLAVQVQAHGFQLVDDDDAGNLGTTEGVTSFRDRTVTIRADRSDASRVKTLAHELAHIALGHEVRRGDVHRGVREVEAESVAMMVTACYGLEFSSDSVPYVAGWSSSVSDRDPVAVVCEVGERARTTALAILKHLPEPSVGDGSPLDLSAMPSRELPEPPERRQPVTATRVEF